MKGEQGRSVAAGMAPDTLGMRVKGKRNDTGEDTGDGERTLKGPSRAGTRNG
jgi:hypothetical protein